MDFHFQFPLPIRADKTSHVRFSTDFIRMCAVTLLTLLSSRIDLGSIISFRRCYIMLAYPEQ